MDRRHTHPLPWSGKPIPESQPTATTAEPQTPRASLLGHCLVLAAVMGLGSLISAGVDRLGIVMPGFVGAMLAGVLVRNLDEQTDCSHIDSVVIGQILGVILCSLSPSRCSA